MLFISLRSWFAHIITSLLINVSFLSPPLSLSPLLSSYHVCSMDMKRCPLCEVIFPPNYDQSKFEEHVESHWKICPMCSEQFPLDCDQKVFENHVLTHFDGHPLNFD